MLRSIGLVIDNTTTDNRLGFRNLSSANIWLHDLTNPRKSNSIQTRKQVSRVTRPKKIVCLGQWYQKSQVGTGLSILFRFFSPKGPVATAKRTVSGKSHIECRLTPFKGDTRQSTRCTILQAWTTTHDIWAFEWRVSLHIVVRRVECRVSWLLT